MNYQIQPACHEVKFSCSCGHTIINASTVAKEQVHLDVCSECHPFYTGKQKIVDTGGRVEKFNARFGKRSKS